VLVPQLLFDNPVKDFRKLIKQVRPWPEAEGEETLSIECILPLEPEQGHVEGGYRNVTEGCFKVTLDQLASGSQGLNCLNCLLNPAIRNCSVVFGNAIVYCTWVAGRVGQVVDSALAAIGFVDYPARRGSIVPG